MAPFLFFVVGFGAFDVVPGAQPRVGVAELRSCTMLVFKGGEWKGLGLRICNTRRRNLSFVSPFTSLLPNVCLMAVQSPSCNIRVRVCISMYVYIYIYTCAPLGGTKPHKPGASCTGGDGRYSSLACRCTSPRPPPPRVRLKPGLFGSWHLGFLLPN